MDFRAPHSGKPPRPPARHRCRAPSRTGRGLLCIALPPALTAIFVALLASCGLPSTLPGLAAPGGILTTAVSGSIFQFNNTIPNPSYSLLGFEVYYKVYDNSSSLAGGAYFTDTSAFTSSTYATPGFAPLTSEGFRRLVAFPSNAVYPVLTGTYAANSSQYLSPSQVQTLQQPPMIPITSSEAASLFVIKMDGSQLSQTGSFLGITGNYTSSGGLLTFANGSQQLSAGRMLVPTTGAGANNTYLKGFATSSSASSFDAYDPDMQSSGIGTSATSIAIGLVVLAYGLDPNVQQVYSIPVPIGYITLSTPQINTN